MTEQSPTTSTHAATSGMTSAHDPAAALGHPLMREIIEASHTFGADPEYVRAGGGNASVKIDGVLYIKPSGTQLATLRAEDLVPLKLDVLRDALYDETPVEGDPVVAAAQRAKIGEPTRRPSVEILFHALIDEPLVLHLHPLTVNALTCNHDGEALARRLFGDDAVWVPYIDPGVPLAQGIDQARRALGERTGSNAPAITLLGNHGVIVAGSTADELGERLRHVTTTIRAAIGTPDAETAPREDAAAILTAVAPRLRGLLSAPGTPVVLASSTSPVARALTASSALVADGPLIPDQIVYAGSFPLVIEAEDAQGGAAAVATALSAYRDRHGKDPLVAVIPGVAVVAAAPDRAKASSALEIFLDQAAVAGTPPAWAASGR